MRIQICPTFLVAVVLFFTAGTAHSQGVAGDYRFIRLTDDAPEQWYADVWGNVVVWQQREDPNPPYPSNIYAMYFDTGQVRRLTEPNSIPYGNSNPAIYENLVAFAGCADDPNAGNIDIWLYDLDTNNLTRLCSEPDMQYYARIWGRYVVWQDKRNNPLPPKPENCDIFGYDLQTGTEFPVCTNQANEQWPDIWANYVVYQSNRSGVKWDIYIYDINTATETRITDDNDYDATQPRINNGRVVWDGCASAGRTYVIVEDINTHQRWVSQPIDLGSPDPRISGNHVAWRGETHTPHIPWNVVTWNSATGEQKDMGWMGSCYSQEGHNLYKGLIVYCQLNESGGRWDVWLACPAADLNCDGEVNFLDFAGFARQWLE